MCNTLINRHPTTCTEQDNSNDQAPEIKLLAMTKRMGRISRFTTLAQAQQEQQLVARIRSGVDAFRKHGRTARQKRNDEFEDSDDEIGYNRPINGDWFFVGLFLHNLITTNFAHPWR